MSATAACPFRPIDSMPLGVWRSPKLGDTLCSVTDVQAAFAADVVRAAEARARGAGPNDRLMQRAATGLTVACLRLLKLRHHGVTGTRVVILAGSGDNGGDALLAGARLRKRGVTVHAILTEATAFQAGMDALKRAGGRVTRLDSKDGHSAAQSQITQADLVVDGIVGLRGKPGLRDDVAALVRAARPETLVVAVDLPSGVDPESGEAREEHVKADITVAFGTLKPCLLVPPASYAAGRVELVDVGLSDYLEGAPLVKRLAIEDVALHWPTPRLTDHKYMRGVLGVIAGSATYPGAAVMTCMGAIRAGASIVKYTGPPSVASLIIAARPEVEPSPGRVNAYTIGSGIVDDQSQEDAVTAALESGLPCVVDAGALTACVTARLSGRRASAAHGVLMTPHAGELSRLLGLVGADVPRAEVEASPWRYARQLARAVDVTVLIKGPTTLVVPPDGLTYSQSEGTPWMAAGGSGDVLAGMAGALMASGVQASLAGALAATVHGRAGSRVSKGGPVAPADLADSVPSVLADLLTT